MEEKEKEKERKRKGRRIEGKREREREWSVTAWPVAPATAKVSRSWPEVAGDGWPRPQGPTNGGASVVENEKLEFCKRCFGERRVGPVERE